MIHIEYPIQFPIHYDLTRISPLEELLFFDIETTGFSADTAMVYLIGCVWHQADGWRLAQWFADSREAEGEVLTAFFKWMSRFTTLVHFNGDTFDIPFLQKRCQRFKLPYSFEGLFSVDIYRKIRPLKNLLGLDNLKQKAVESFLGVEREDVYSGGELIEIYGQYLRSQDNKLLKLLLLHNEDDLKGMPSILPILAYTDLMEGPFSFLSSQETQAPFLEEPAASILTLNYQTPISLPASFQAGADWLTCLVQGDRLSLQVRLFHGELKYFYPNYKDYYYLPCEDMAVHRSVGEYVDPQARKKASAKTCYTRTSGIFLPQPAPIWSPALQRDYKDCLRFAAYEPDMFRDQEKASAYALQALTFLKGKK